MPSISFLGLLGYLETLLVHRGACLLIAKKQWRDYWALGCFLALRAGSDIALNSVHAASSVGSSTSILRIAFISIRTGLASHLSQSLLS